MMWEVLGVLRSRGRGLQLSFRSSIQSICSSVHPSRAPSIGPDRASQGPSPASLTTTMRAAVAPVILLWQSFSSSVAAPIFSAVVLLALYEASLGSSGISSVWSLPLLEVITCGDSCSWGLLLWYVIAPGDTCPDLSRARRVSREVPPLIWDQSAGSRVGEADGGRPCSLSPWGW